MTTASVHSVLHIFTIRHNRNIIQPYQQSALLSTGRPRYTNTAQNHYVSIAHTIILEIWGRAQLEAARHPTSNLKYIIGVVR